MPGRRGTDSWARFTPWLLAFIAAYIGFMLWSDRNYQLGERLAQAGIEPSVGSRGDSYDNALAETINGLYKTELIHRRAPWKTKESLELATLEWVSWFNNHRLLEPIGYIPPAEAEANYYGQLAEKSETPVSL